MTFKKNLLGFIRPSPNCVFNIHNPAGLKFLTRLRLGLSHLNDHKFKHNFRDCINPLCSCSLEPETTAHYFLRCNHYCDIRTDLMNDLNSEIDSFPTLSDDRKVILLLYGDAKLDHNKNSRILTASIDYIMRSERFSGPLFWTKKKSSSTTLLLFVCLFICPTPSVL